MQYNGENECFVCGHNIRWQGHITQPRMTAHTVDGSKEQAEIFAVGKVMTSEGVKTEFEVVVKCPNCKNTNKFR